MGGGAGRRQSVGSQRGGHKLATVNNKLGLLILKNSDKSSLRTQSLSNWSLKDRDVKLKHIFNAFSPALDKCFQTSDSKRKMSMCRHI